MRFLPGLPIGQWSTDAYRITSEPCGERLAFSSRRPTVWEGCGPEGRAQARQLWTRRASPACSVKRNPSGDPACFPDPSMERDGGSMCSGQEGGVWGNRLRVLNG